MIKVLQGLAVFGLTVYMSIYGAGVGFVVRSVYFNLLQSSINPGLTSFNTVILGLCLIGNTLLTKKSIERIAVGIA